MAPAAITLSSLTSFPRIFGILRSLRLFPFHVRMFISRLTEPNNETLTIITPLNDPLNLTRNLTP